MDFRCGGSVNFVGTLHAPHSTHLARRTEGMVGLQVRLGRAGIVLSYVSSPLVGTLYAWMGLLGAFDPIHFKKNNL